MPRCTGSGQLRGHREDLAASQPDHDSAFGCLYRCRDADTYDSATRIPSKGNGLDVPAWLSPRQSGVDSSMAPLGSAFRQLLIVSAAGRSAIARVSQGHCRTITLSTRSLTFSAPLAMHRLPSCSATAAKSDQGRHRRLTIKYRAFLCGNALAMGAACARPINSDMLNKSISDEPQSLATQAAGSRPAPAYQA